MKLKQHELDWLAVKIKEHIDGSLLSADDINYYYSKLPSNLLYSGIAYRVIYHKDHENLNFSLNNNRCFSKTIESLDQFINNQKYHNATLPYKKYKTNVNGIDINLLVLWLKQQNYEVSEKFFFEDEIIAVEIGQMLEI
jgi:hypothetical protein